jgi:signal transduction histidine kinase
LGTKSMRRPHPIVAAVLSLFLLSLSVLAGIDLLMRAEYLDRDHYFASDSFANQLTEYARLVEKLHTEYAGYDRLSPDQKVDPKQVQQMKSQLESKLRKQQQEIQKRYDASIAEANKAGRQVEASRLTAEKQQRLAEAEQAALRDLERWTEEQAAARDRQYEILRNRLAFRNGAFRYYITDRKTNQVYTNLEQQDDPETYIREKAMRHYTFPLPNKEDTNLIPIHNMFLRQQWEGYLILLREPEGYSRVHTDYHYYLGIRERLIKEGFLLAASLAGLIALSLYPAERRRQTVSVLEKGHAVLRRIPLDVRTVLFGLIALIALVYTVITAHGFFRLPLDPLQPIELTLVALLLGYFAVSLYDFVGLGKHRGERLKQWEESLIRRMVALVRDSRNLMGKVAAAFVLSVGLGMAIMLALIAVHDELIELLLLAFAYMAFYFLAVVPYVLRRIRMLSRLMKGVEEIAAGNLDVVLEEGRGGILSRLARNINNMKQGFQQAVESRVKSERLKSELITNVSHDLKTPLTSIINYVDLLKRGDLSAEEVERYVAVLDRKTQRLKVLIDDLFEAAKMASGAVELSIEEIDVAALLEQALAEFEEKWQSASLQVKVDMARTKMYARVDGKKTWRVLENLIGNALKYAMPGTRVHISLAERENRVWLTIKNVSAYPIDFAAEELFERFKRGDQSRHTEGSGLGLAIAKSIMDLQGGKLLLEIDGDYFKVMVEFPK